MGNDSSKLNSGNSARNTLNASKSNGLGATPTGTVRSWREFASEDWRRSPLALAYMVWFQKGDAPELLKKAAVLGYVHCQFALAVYYSKYEKNEAKAVPWYKMAAEQDHPRSQSALGLILIKDRDDKAKAATGVDWLRKSAAQGDTKALVALAKCLAQGIGTSQDRNQAGILLRQAAIAGDPNAQEALGLTYLYDASSATYGLKRDAEQAVSWLLKAADPACSRPEPRIVMGKITAGENFIVKEEEMRPAHGLVAAQLMLAECYDEGLGVTKDEEKAVFWLQRAVEQKSPEAYFRLGVRYQNGRGVAKDDGQAAVWFQRAAENGHKEAEAVLQTYHALLAKTAKQPTTAETASLSSAVTTTPGQLMVRQAVICKTSAAAISSGSAVTQNTLDSTAGVNSRGPSTNFN